MLQHLSIKLCTPNLHHLLCYLHHQEAGRGDTWRYCELWVERQMQVAKQRCKYRCTLFPEKVLVSDLSLTSALQRLQSSRAAPLLDCFELNPAYQNRPAVGPAYDHPAGAPDGTVMLDKGQPLAGAGAWDALRAGVKRMVELTPADNLVSIRPTGLDTSILLLSRDDTWGPQQTLATSTG